MLKVLSPRGAGTKPAGTGAEDPATAGPQRGGTVRREADAIKSDLGDRGWGTLEGYTMERVGIVPGALLSSLCHISRFSFFNFFVFTTAFSFQVLSFIFLSFFRCRTPCV